MLLVASQISNLLNTYELADVIIILAVAFFIYKEAKKYVVEAKKEKKDDQEAYYNNRHKEESHDQDVEARLCKLETNMKKDYDRIRQSESHLFQLENTVNELNIFVRDLRIETMRTTILNAIPKCIDMNQSVSAEEYKNLFKTYEDYEKILEKNKLQNGETRLAINLLKHSYEQRLASNNFTESRYLSPEVAKERIKSVSDAIPGFWEMDDYLEIVSDEKEIG